MKLHTMKKSLHKLKLPLSCNPNMQLGSSHLLFCLNNCLLLEVSDLLDQSTIKVISHISSQDLILESRIL